MKDTLLLKGMMNFADARARGLPNGSGAVVAACKSLTRAGTQCCQDDRRTAVGASRRCGSARGVAQVCHLATVARRQVSGALTPGVGPCGMESAALSCNPRLLRTDPCTSFSA